MPEQGETGALLPAGSQTDARTTLDTQAVNDFIEKVPLFRRLPQEEIPILARAMHMKEFKAGTVIFKQGDKGDAFYVIQTGEARYFNRMPRN